MILFTNGCSWTWGGALEPWMKENHIINHEKRLSLVWPHHLGKMLSAEQVINLAEGCGSNQRTVRTTYDWLKEQPTSVLNETVAVIQITELSRFELYEPITIDKHENFPGQWIKCKWDIVSSDSIHKSKWDYDRLMERRQNRIKETHTIEDLYRNIGYMYALESMFNLFKIKKWYFWITGGQFNWQVMFTKPNAGILFSQFNILDKDETWKYERVGKNDTHPSIVGHQQIAEIIYNKIV